MRLNISYTPATFRPARYLVQIRLNIYPTSTILTPTQKFDLVMQFPLNPKPSRRPIARRQSLSRSLRRATLRMLPVILLIGALVQVAHAQSSGTQTAVPSALSSLVSTLGVFAFLALIVGLFRPKTFAFLFKEKATRGRVCGTFGAAWLFLVILGPPLVPRRVATTQVAQNTTQGSSASGKSSDAVRLVENRAKAAEARATRADKAAAVSNAKENASAKSRDANRKDANREEANRRQVNKDLGIPDSLLPPQTAPNSTSSAELPDNVSEIEIEGVGKRQIGVVDEVVYTVAKAEKGKALGNEMVRREADGVFYVLWVVAVNTSKKTHDVTTAIMKLVDDQEREFDPSTEGALALAMSGDKGAQPFSAQVQPGVTKNFKLVYDAPADAKGLKLHIPAGFGFGRSADIKVPTAGE